MPLPIKNRSTIYKRNTIDLPSKSKVVKFKRPRKKKNNLNNFFANFFRIIFLIFLSICVIPYCYNKITKPLFLSFNKNKAVKTDYYHLINPTTSYITNNSFLNRRFLSGANEKKPLMQKFHLSKELTELKKQIVSISKKYPQISPSVFVFDYQTNNYVAINADVQRPTASIIKLPILIELFKSIEYNQVSLTDKIPLTSYFRTEGSGDLQYNRQGSVYDLDYLARIMITNSDNSATNMILSHIGGKVDINRAMKLWGLKNSHIQNWLPDLEGENVSTAFDIGTILYNLDNSSFLTLNSREKIIDYMSHVKNDRLIASSLSNGALIVHKTGDIGKMLGDAGIVYMPNGKRYIIVMMVTRPHNSISAKEFIIEASKTVYTYMENNN